MSIMLVLLIVSCDTTPKPVTDTTGILTVEPTERGNKLSIIVNDGTGDIYINRKKGNEEKVWSYMVIRNRSSALTQGTHTFIDEFVEKDALYSYNVELLTKTSEKLYSEAVQVKAIGGKGLFAITNKPTLTYDSNTNTFTLSEALTYTNSGFEKYGIYFMFTLDGSTYGGIKNPINNQFDFKYVHESLYGKQFYVKGMMGHGYGTQNEVSVEFMTSNILNSNDLGFTGPFVIKKLN